MMSPSTVFVNIIGGLFLKLNPTTYIYFWALIGGALCNALTAGFLGLFAALIFRGSPYLIIFGVLVSIIGSPFDNMDAIIQYYTLPRLIIITYLYLFIYLVSREADTVAPYFFLGALNSILIFCLPQLVIYCAIPLIYFSIESFVFKSHEFRWKEFLFIIGGFSFSLLLMLAVFNMFGYFEYPESFFSFHANAMSFFDLLYSNYHDLFQLHWFDIVWIILIVLLFMDEKRFKFKRLLFCLTLCFPICYLILKISSIGEKDVFNIWHMQFFLYSDMNRTIILFPCFLAIFLIIYHFYPLCKNIFLKRNIIFGNSKVRMSFTFKMSPKHGHGELSQDLTTDSQIRCHPLKNFLKKISKLPESSFFGISIVCCFVILTFHVCSSMGAYRAYYMQPVASMFFLIPAIQISIRNNKRFYINALCIFLIVSNLLIQNIFSYSQPIKTSFTEAFISLPLRGLFYEKEYVLAQNEFVQEASRHIQPGSKIFMPTQEYGLLLALNARPQYVSYCIPANYLDKLRKGDRPEWILLHPHPWWEAVIRQENNIRFLPEKDLIFAPISSLRYIKDHLQPNSVIYAYIDIVYFLRKIVFPKEYELVIKHNHYHLYRYKGQAK